MESKSETTPKQKREIPGEVVRPLWFLVIVLLVGMVAVAGIIALFKHHLLHLLFLFPLLMGVAGGTFGWLWADRLGQEQTRKAAVYGLVLSLGIYALYRYFDYLLFVNTLEAGALVPSFVDYIFLTAEAGMVFSRRLGQQGLELGPIFVWLYWLLELGIIGGMGTWIAGKMKL